MFFTICGHGGYLRFTMNCKLHMKFEENRPRISTEKSFKGVDRRRTDGRRTGVITIAVIVKG